MVSLRQRTVPETSSKRLLALSIDRRAYAGSLGALGTGHVLPDRLLQQEYEVEATRRGSMVPEEVCLDHIHIKVGNSGQSLQSNHQYYPKRWLLYGHAGLCKFES